MEDTQLTPTNIYTETVSFKVADTSNEGFVPQVGTSSVESRVQGLGGVKGIVTADGDVIDEGSPGQPPKSSAEKKKKKRHSF